MAPDKSNFDSPKNVHYIFECSVAAPMEGGGRNVENGHVKSGLYVQVLTDLVDVEALVILFEQVATEQDWQPGGQIRANTERAVHFAASVGDDLAGGLQLVLPDTGGCLPYMAVWPEIALPSPSQVAEVTVLAVKQEYRGRYGLFWPLCVELWRYCISE